MLFLFLFLFGLALGAASPTGEHPLKLQRGKCPDSWQPFNGRCYRYFNTDKTWSQAELYCVSQKANLVSIHSQEEQDFVTSLIKFTSNHEGYTWIGLSDAHKEGKRMWSDGSALDFVYMSKEEPDIHGNKDCFHTNYDFRNKWDDIICSITLPFVCATRIDCP